jgi:hypothetical protein
VPFPNLTLRPDTQAPLGVAQLWAEATGVPDNGPNTFALPFVDQPPSGSGIAPEEIQEDWLEVIVTPLGAGVTGATPGAPFLSADKQFVTIDFTADGIAAANVIIRLYHSLER